MCCDRAAYRWLRATAQLLRPVSQHDSVGRHSDQRAPLGPFVLDGRSGRARSTVGFSRIDKHHLGQVRDLDRHLGPC